MPEFAGEQANLAPVVRVVREEVTQQVHDIRRETSDFSADCQAMLQYAGEGGMAFAKCRNGFHSSSPYPSQATRRLNTQLAAEHLDPHAPDIMDVDYQRSNGLGSARHPS